MTRSHALRRVVYVACLGAFIACMGYGVRHRSRQTVQLYPGAAVSLEAVTLDEPHRFDSASWWLKVSRPFSRDHGAKVGLNEAPGVPPEVPVAWVSYKEPLHLAGIRTITVFDQHGCETPVQTISWSGGAPDSVSAVPLLKFPRRSPWIGLRYYVSDTGSNSRTAELRFPNPRPGDYPTWTPESLPARRSSDGGELELTHFSTGADERMPDRPPRHGGVCNTWTHLSVRMTRNGKPDPDRMPFNVELRDATGNQFLPACINREREGALWRLSFPGNLFADEAAWKVNLEVARTASAHFAADEFWTVRRAPRPPLPVNGRILDTPVGARTQWRDLNLELSSLCWSGIGPPYLEAMVTVRGASLNGYHLRLVRAVTDRGYVLPIPDVEVAPVYFTDAPDPVTAWEFPMILKKPAKTVDLTFAVEKTRTVEFLAAPTRPKSRH